MQTPIPVNRAAPLKNVAAFATLISRVVERRTDLPGMGCFFGASGLGKTKSAVFGATRYRAAYVECDQFTTAKSLLQMILKELGVSKPRGTVTELISEAVMRMGAEPNKPVVVDEAHHIAHKKFVDVLRTLHDKSSAPVILIGEDTLPTDLTMFERVHNRMLDWVEAVPLDEEDFQILAKMSCPGVSLKPDLADAILSATGGNTRRTVINLARADEVARSLGLSEIDLASFGGKSALIGTKAPIARRRAS